MLILFYFPKLMPMKPQSPLVVGIRAIVSKRYKWEQTSDATLEKTLVSTQRLEVVPKLCAAHDGGLKIKRSISFLATRE